MNEISLYSLSIIILFFVTVVGVLAALLIGKFDQVKQLRLALNKMKYSFEELDEQAKLIIRTDLQLNKAEAQLDKGLHSLNALEKTSRLISTTLDEEEIFKRLKESFGESLNFERALIAIFDRSNILQPKAFFGISDGQPEKIIESLKENTAIQNVLSKGSPVSSDNAEPSLRQAISDIFGVNQFILTPILSQNGLQGLLLVGNQSVNARITGGDEELIAILGNQIGQSLENARLFEEVYKSTRVLESKVQERTKQLASALEEVNKISRMKSEFISAVSHELRTPLTSIKGYAAILMEGKLGDVPQNVKERLAKINTHSDNLVKFINDLLDISRIESGRIPMNIEECSLSEIVSDVGDLLTPQLKEKKIQWVVNIDPATPLMFVDKNNIERVFINLVSNAVKFTPEEGLITIRTKPEKEQVTVEVSDTGIGISDEDAAKLFDEFYRVENTINQNVKGTGLGLSLVKKIVEAHQGKIWVTSKINEGTTFHFTLPIRSTG